MGANLGHPGGHRLYLESGFCPGGQWASGPGAGHWLEGTGGVETAFKVEPAGRVEGDTFPGGQVADGYIPVVGGVDLLAIGHFDSDVWGGDFKFYRLNFQ